MRLLLVGVTVPALFAAAGIVCGASLGAANAAPVPGQQEPARQRQSVGVAIPYSVGRALPDRVGGWVRSAQIQLFSPADLWEYIDGAAEQYLTYGVQDVATAKYTNSSGAVVGVDVYRMADSVNAFGIYRQELSPKARPVAIGVEGRAGSSSLKFWSGSFYVKLTASPAGGPQPGLEALADAIAKGLGESGGMPAQVNWFPAAGLVPDSLKFVPADALGQSAFSNAFEAKYENPREPSTALVVPFESEQRAVAALARYEAFLAKASGRTKVASPGNGGFSATDSFHGFILAVRAGSSLAISLGASDERTASVILAQIVKRLPSAPAGQPRKEGSR
jgi:hypothetical protein